MFRTRNFDTAETLLQIEDLRVVLAEDPKTEVLGGVSVWIRAGESGSGKSTVARCVMRLIDPSSGYIAVNGEDVAKLNCRQLHPVRQHIQIVFQDPCRSLNPQLTIGDSMVEGPVNFGVPREEAQARAADLMELVGLPRTALTRYPHRFSGGQRQRIAIVRAVAMKPQVIVADEAVSVQGPEAPCRAARLDAVPAGLSGAADAGFAMAADAGRLRHVR